MDSRGTNQIARQIHDGIAQDLVALGYRLDQSLGTPELPTSTRAELRTLRFAVTDLIEKVRREILNLRSVSPDLEDQVVQICGDRLGEVSLAVNLDPSLNPIVIELIRNAAEHSGASVINLNTKQDRFGLVGVTEAIAELSGQIEFINLAPGLLIRVSIPS